jgi:hypothetical protein
MLIYWHIPQVIGHGRVQAHDACKELVDDMQRPTVVCEDSAEEANVENSSQDLSAELNSEQELCFVIAFSVSQMEHHFDQHRARHQCQNKCLESEQYQHRRAMGL